jgi:hypothetical protein
MSNATYQTPSEVGRWRSVALGIGGIATIVMIAIAFLVEGQRELVLRAWLLGFMLWGGIAIGGLGILMLQYLTGGAWGMMLRRTVEAASRTIIVVVLLFIPIVVGVGDLYEWSHLQDDRIVQWRGWYLTWSGFAVRAAIYFAVIFLMQYLLNKWSAKMDASKDYTEAAKHLETASRFSGPAMVIYALVVSFMAIDWTMTLDPHWFSTIWGLLYVVSWALACFAFVITLFMLMMEKEPLKSTLGKKHFHDIGKLMFALVMVWAYFNFSQFLIIWSGNIPEETPWYIKRMENGWEIVGILLIVFHFAVPFLILLSRDIKRHAKRLAVIAMFILLMRVVDMFYHIAPSPSTMGAEPVANVFWLLYIVGPVAVGGLWLWAFFGELQKRPMLPPMDPLLQGAIDHGKGH